MRYGVDAVSARAICNPAVALPTSVRGQAGFLHCNLRRFGFESRSFLNGDGTRLPGGPADELNTPPIKDQCPCLVRFKKKPGT